MLLPVSWVLCLLGGLVVYFKVDFKNFLFVFEALNDLAHTL